ncbi:MAG: hypothetical protein IT314_10630 [Anaerolineales bacterium]|nr:hypothetical protein [Anaerolineales bacterium]
MARASIASKPFPDRRLIIAITALLAVLFYLLMSAAVFHIGFPLDDTWIHLTYARNFAEHGEWAFRLGEESAGSTSPLWTFLLSIGFFLRLAPYVWTFFLGWLVLTALGVFAENAARKLVVLYTSPIPWVGLFFVLAWHLTWSAVSGMETLLHGLILFVVLVELIKGSRRYLALGALAGLSVWVRPDGMTLLGPIMFTALLTENSWSARGSAMFKVVMGFGALFLFYLLFNLALSGNPLPNTFYAKQAEYRESWLSETIVERSVEYLLPILASPFLALLPGAVTFLKKAISARNWGVVAGAIWFIGYIAIYFARLPAYQHGRYIVPALPILYFWGMAGFVEFIGNAKSNVRLMLLWKSILVALCIAFGFVGAQQYARDVYFIESEMVATAKWVRQNLPQDSLLAVHDIGAVGYFTNNPLLDLAGLINPEVVPFIRDEARLADYLDARSADYLITLPSFYPSLTSGKEAVFVAGAEENPVAESERMVVYRWRLP